MRKIDFSLLAVLLNLINNNKNSKNIYKFSKLNEYNISIIKQSDFFVKNFLEIDLCRIQNVHNFYNQKHKDILKEYRYDYFFSNEFSSLSIEEFLSEKFVCFNTDYKNNIEFRNLTRCTLEIAKNSFQHGNARETHIAILFNIQLNLIVITISNLGDTFKSNYLKKREYIFEDNIEAIEYSYKNYNSSRPYWESGGIGFNVVKDFLMKNKGSVTFFSGDSCVSEDYDFSYDIFYEGGDELSLIKNEKYPEMMGIKKKYKSNNEFPGSIISFKVPINKNFLENTVPITTLSEYVFKRKKRGE